MPAVENVLVRVATPALETVCGVPIWAPLAKKVMVPEALPVLTTVAVKVTGAVVLTVVELQAPVFALSVVRVRRELTKVPLSGKFEVAPLDDFTVSVPAKGPRTVGVAVTAIVQSVVPSLLAARHVKAPSLKLVEPDVRLNGLAAGASLAAK